MYSALSRSQRGGGGFLSKPRRETDEEKNARAELAEAREELAEAQRASAAAQAAREKARREVPDPDDDPDGENHRNINDMKESIKKLHSTLQTLNKALDDEKAAEERVKDAERRVKAANNGKSVRNTVSKKGGRRRYTLRKRKGIRR